MSRQQYESKTDRENEKAVIEILCRRNGYSYKKLPKDQYLDYRITDNNGDVVCLVEVKCRCQILKDQYSTFFISQSKVVAAKSVAEPVYVAVLWADAIGTTNLKKPDFIRVNDGRTQQTRDKWDIERMAHFNIDKFKIY